MATSGFSGRGDVRSWTTKVEPIEGRTAALASEHQNPRSGIDGMTARQRMQVYMHSTIFDNGGPTVEAVHDQKFQKELQKNVIHAKVRANNTIQPQFSMPKANDMRLTDVAGHAVVAPSSHDHHELVHAANQKPSSLVSTLKFSNPETMVANGTAIKVVNAKAPPRKGETGYIPKEYFQTHTDMYWSDCRAEMSRQQKSRYELDEVDSKAPDRTAKELKLHNLSSEMPFGPQRMVNVSTAEPRADIFFNHLHFLSNDSIRDRIGDRGDARPAKTHRERKQHNLQDSHSNVLDPSWTSKGDARRTPAAADEDPMYSARRRQEKNFSDLFGTEMMAREQLRNRLDMTASQTSTCLDTRNETACRNIDHCQGNHDMATTARDRKLATNSSSLHDYAFPAVDKDLRQEHLQNEERTCWDSTCFRKNGIMNVNSELVRRFRLKELDAIDAPGPVGAHLAFDRTQDNLGSTRMRLGLNQEMPHSAQRPASRNLHSGVEAPAHIGLPPRQARQAFLASPEPFAFAHHRSNL